MSDDIEAISVRATRLNNFLILGRSEATTKIPNGLCQESLLDTRCLLYDECNKDHLKKKDKNVYEYVKKYNPVIKETGNSRININDFRVKTLIGNGYFGDVHLATKKTTNDVYAIKKILKGNAITTSQLREVRDIMARTNLRLEVPPIIPTISNEEDVSNFEGVDWKGRQSTYNKTRPNTTCKGNEFSGQNLPYLGYSYVNPQTTDSMLPVRNQSSENLTIRIIELERTIDEHVKHIKSLQREVSDARRQSAQTKSLEKILMEAKMEVTSLKKQLEEEDAELASFKIEVITLKEDIALLLNFNYQKWEKAKFASEKSYEDRVAQQTTKIISLIKNLSAQESEMNSKVDECKHLQSLVEKYQELAIVSDRIIDEIKSRMNRQIEVNKALRQEKVNIERKMQELQKKCDEYSNELNRMRMEQLTPNRMSDGGSEDFCSVRGSWESLSGVEELTKQLATSQGNEDQLRQRAERLEQVVSRFELAVNNLEQQKSAENLLARQNEKLEGELNTVREQAILERQTSRTAFLSLHKLEQQVEDLNAEKKKQFVELEKADKNLKRMRDEKDDIQVQLRDAQATIRLKESRITELQSEIQSLNDDLKKEYEMWEKAELERMKEKSEIIEQVSNVHKLQEKFQDEEKRKLNTLTQHNIILNFNHERLLKKHSSLRDELAQSNEYANKLESGLNEDKRSFEMLKYTCTLMKAQLDKLQAMYKTEMENKQSLCEKSLRSQVKGHHDVFKKLRTHLNDAQLNVVESLFGHIDLKCRWKPMPPIGSFWCVWHATNFDWLTVLQGV